METHQKIWGLEPPADQTMEMMRIKRTRMMTEEKVGMKRSLPITEDGTRDPQTMRERNKKIGFPAY